MLTLLFLVVFLMIVMSMVTRGMRRGMERRRMEQEEMLRRMEQEGGGPSPFAGSPFGPLFESLLFGTGAQSYEYDPRTGEWVETTDRRPDPEPEPKAERE